MYFILSKVLLFILFPLCWVAALLITAIFAKKPKIKKRSLIAALAVLVIFSNPFLLAKFAEKYDLPPGTINKNKVYSAAIILGGFSGEDKNGQGYFNDKSDRFIQALKLKATGQVSHIFVSGGSGNPQQDKFTEAGWVKSQLLEFKIPDSLILTELRSRNTFENAAFTKTILEHSHLPPPYLLVTSAFHMRRAFYIFKKEGMDVTPYPCGYLAGNNKLYLADYLTFDTGTLNSWNYYLKEIVGL
ncbi:MAG: YdcF family protein, partial [Mucilaginibacter sp.]